MWLVYRSFLQGPHINGLIEQSQIKKSVLLLSSGGIVLELQHAQIKLNSAILFAKYKIDVLNYY
jgi:hypothetical protein